MIYFDNAATTPMCKASIDAMHKCMQNNFGNPSSIHAAGRKSRTLIEQARKEIAQALNASIGEIFFTSGGTESNNTAIKNAIRDLGVEVIISSPIEHHSVVHTLDQIREEHTADVVLLEVDKYGRINPDIVQEALQQYSDKRILVSIMHANNEIGTINDIHTIGEICKENDAYFHTDTVQTIGHLPIDVNDNYISFLSGSAHKFHGPKGTGFLYVNNENIIDPYVHGGSQERNMRAGTENLAGIVGMHSAFTEVIDNLDENREKVIALREHFKERLEKEFDDISYNGCQENFLQTVLNVSFPPHPKNDMLILNLDIKGICASGGSACSSGSDIGSHVIKALDSTVEDRADVRFSFSHFNNKEEIDRTIVALKEILS